MNREVMQKGAVDFIQKPFRDQELLDQISEALKTDQQRRSARDRKAEVSNRVEKLTKRECEVMDLVVTGKPNKVIAYELGVSQRTVEIHRARVMEKWRQDHWPTWSACTWRSDQFRAPLSSPIVAHSIHSLAYG